MPGQTRSVNAALPRLGGVVVPLITPVDHEERVDEAAFRRQIRFCLEAGVDAIFIGGSAGMGPLLTDGEWTRAMEIAASEVADPARLLGGVIETSTSRAVARIRILERVGVRRMVITPTYYITLVREAEFMAHFAACRQAGDFDFIAYNIPGCTYCQVPVAVMRTLCEKGWISAIKESSGDRDYFAELLGIGKEHGVAVLQGNEPDIEWGLLAGAAGIVPVCANYEPETYVKAARAARAGDRAALSGMQKRIDLLRQALLLGEHNWIAGMMHGVAARGTGSGRPLLPLQPPPAETQTRIAAFGKRD